MKFKIIVNGVTRQIESNYFNINQDITKKQFSLISSNYNTDIKDVESIYNLCVANENKPFIIECQLSDNANPIVFVNKKILFSSQLSARTNHSDSAISLILTLNYKDEE